MTANEVRTFAERHIEHWKALDAAAIAADHAPDGVVESPSAGTHQGHEAICKALQKWFDSFPDMRFPTEQIVADADAMRRSSSSPSRERSRGEFFGVPATGQHLESRLVLALRFENGLIVHVRLHPRTGQRRGDQDQPLVSSRPRYSQPNPAVLTTGQACPVAVTQRVPVFLGSLRFLADRRWHVACFSSWCLLACTAG